MLISTLIVYQSMIRSPLLSVFQCVCLSGFCGVKAIQTFTADSSLLSVYFVLSK